MTSAEVGAGGWTSRRRGLATAALAAVVVVSILVVQAVVLVRALVLDAETYTSALVEVDAYERIYTEVLADPELADVQHRLLGEFGLDEMSASQVRAVGTNALRLVLPPDVVRTGLETLVSATLAYIRGDTRQIDADVAIDTVVSRIGPVTVARVRTGLAAAIERQVASLDAYEAAIADLADELASGTVPASIPVLGGRQFDPEEVIDAILEPFGNRVSADLRERVTTAVLAGDERNALIDAAGELAAEFGTTVARRLGAEAESGEDFDIVAAAAEHARQPARDVVSSLDTVRSAARWLALPTAVVAAVLGAAALGGIVALNRGRPSRAVAVVAASLLAAGVAWVVLWRLVRSVVAPPLRDAASTGPGSLRLPPAIRDLIADLQANLADELSGAVWRLALILLIVAIGLIAILGTVHAVPRLDARALLGLSTAAALGLALVGTVTVRPVAADAGRLCNGHAELCDRRYDEVVFAATHNSMSSPDVVQIWPEHDGDIAAQLDAGVRALLIDTHYWEPVDAIADLTEHFDDIGPGRGSPVLDYVYRRLGALRDGRDGTFLCHNHCAFGGIEFVDAMVTVREFVEDNPDDVVTMVIQDEITPEDTLDVMRESGLEPYLYAHDDDSWPTLGELIDRGERVVVFAENAGPPPDWYANAFESMRETPFLFRSPDELSCASNRGPEDAPLFLMNHWISTVTPDRVNAVTVNGHDALVERARQCAGERGALPNFIAVDFYNIGDLIAAVDTLNAVGRRFTR